MRIFAISFTILVILAWLSCSQKKSEQKIPLSYQAGVLMDSLGKLDTLILKTSASDPQLAIRYGHESGTIAGTLKTPEANIRAFIALGNAFSRFKTDSSFYYYNEALKLSDSSNNNSYRHKLLYDLAVLYVNAYDYKVAVSFLDSSFKLSIKKRDFAEASTCLNAIGNVYIKMKNPRMAKILYDSAYSMAVRSSNEMQMGVALGNLAMFASNKEENYKLLIQAIKLIGDHPEGNELKASLYANLSNIFTNPDSSVYYSRLALNLIDPKSTPEPYIAICNNLACTYSESGQLDKALEYAGIALSLCQSTGNYDWMATVYETFSEIQASLKNYPEALHLEKLSVDAMQKAYEKSAVDQVQLLSAILDSKNKENIIRENKMEIDRTHSSIHAKNQLILIIILVSMLLSGSFLYLFQRKKMKYQKDQLQAAKKIIEAEENEKTKLSRNFHDLTGQKILGLYHHLENSEFSDASEKDEALGRVKDIKEITRELSHQMNKGWLENFSFEKNLEGLCVDFIKMGKFKLKYDLPDNLPDLNDSLKINVYRILQEILTNAARHAPGTDVLLSVTFTASDLELTYRDEGPGFVLTEKRTGLGLSNIFERVKLLNGKIEADTHPGFGTYYNIIVPYQNN